MRLTNNSFANITLRRSSIFCLASLVFLFVSPSYADTCLCRAVDQMHFSRQPCPKIEIGVPVEDQLPAARFNAIELSTYLDLVGHIAERAVCYVEGLDGPIAVSIQKPVNLLQGLERLGQKNKFKIQVDDSIILLGPR